MWAQGAAQEFMRLQRLHHGAGRVPEVRAAERRCGLPPRQWLVNDPAARRWWESLRHVPEERRAQLALRMQRGVELVVEESVGRAREHAARQVQWAYRRLQLLQCLGAAQSGAGALGGAAGGAEGGANSGEGASAGR